jgi:hypothetical protein
VISVRKIKVCATCKYLELLEKGQEFPGLLDSEYLVFRCTLRDWTVREDYLMKSCPQEIDGKESHVSTCPYWEEWKSLEEEEKCGDNFLSS